MSVLSDTKQVLGIEPDYDFFDLDLRLHIDASLSLLYQVASAMMPTLSPITNDTGWDELIKPQYRVYIPVIQRFVALQTRLIFDPPATGFATSAIERQLEELTWRLSVIEEVE